MQVTKNDNKDKEIDMIIERIDIKSFGQLTDTSLDFASSVNVIEGQNEVGKSTIAAFIKYMLYGFNAEEGDSELGERAKRLNWDTGIAQGSMNVMVGDKHYLITRSTVPTTDASQRTVYKEESSIIDLETGAPAFGKLPAGEVFFGVDRELFENTAFVGQIGDTSIDEGTVKASIENILFSGSERINNQKAAARISEKMEQLHRKNGTGGAISDLISKRDAIEEQLRKSREDNQQILAKEAELHEIKAQRSVAEDKLAKLYDLDNCYKNVMLIQTFDKLHELEEECEAKTAAYNQYVEDNTRNGFAPTQQYLTDIAVARRSVNDAYHNLITAQNVHNEHKNAVGITREIEGSIEKADELGGEASILARAAEFFSKQIKSLAIAAGGALIILAALIFEIIGAVKKLPAVATISVGLVGFVVLVASAIFAFIFFKNKKLMANLAAEFSTENYQDLKLKIQLVSEARAKRDGMIAATESARVNVENAKAAYERSKRELTSVILRWGEEPPKTELNKFLDELKAKVTKYLDGKNALYEEKNEIEITVREIRRTLADKSEVDIRAQVSPLKRKALSGINHDEIINGIADFKAEIAEQDRIAFNIENELFTLKARAGDPADLYAKIAAIDKRLEELRLAHKAYFIALSAIENASDNLRAEISPRLAEYSTDLMGIMTNKKYTSFDVSDGLKVTFKDADGEERSVDFLSGGTRDLTYIAVRMALIDMLYDDKPPIVFDESFAHQDNLRARSMMAGLSKLSEDGIQSFVFTCRAREGALAKEIVADCGVYKLSVVDEEFA